MSDLVKRLRIKAGMIEMGEMIAWGSDSALMREAADALEMAAPAVQGGPVAYISHTSEGDILGWERQFDAPNHTTLYAAPQPAEQQPDITQLVEALEQGFPLLSDEGLDEVEHHCEWVIQRERKRVHSILAAHRKGGEA